jgi:elongation factor Ts
VARTDEFRTLARELAMQVAASAPRYTSRDEVPPDVVAAQREEIAKEAAGIAPDEIDRRLDQWFEEVVLLDQPYIRDAGRRVGDMVTDVVARLGERVHVRRFARFKLGE